MFVDEVIGGCNIFEASRKWGFSTVVINFLCDNYDTVYRVMRKKNLRLVYSKLR